ncbi:primosomal protein N' [Virgisporangium ochraceum]|uniref:Probable replication restart protein PriA n=1 Tax=Virgisporangium ochraceum TaxID=65505 RepID=A0A8J4A306_9ACTN|nr:primosomal protein N' [Virgisporangium ochraceum]GIJ74191.1 putative primosomal protein N' [Virgisporangium ochraceum]
MAPVARVVVEVGLPHLDRPFDYLVAAADDVAAQPGVRVRVRFAGQLVGGFLLERMERSEHDGRLAYLDRVVSAERVLTPEVADLCRLVADRYAGTHADVLRLAVPPRHARVEAARAGAETPHPQAHTDDALSGAPSAPESALDRASSTDGPGWDRYRAGAAFLRALRDGRAPRAVWGALPGEDWPARVADAIAAVHSTGRGALAVVADARDLDRLDAALTAKLGGPGQHVALNAALGPAERYRRFLAAARGTVRIVTGTRAAALAPVENLGLVVIWDDGDDLHAEPRAPYPHARQVLLTRAEQTGCAALVGGFTRTAEAQQLVEAGWAHDLVADRAAVRDRAPRVVPVGDDNDPAAGSARLPTVAWKAARAALAAGAPVLVQVPRRGYVPSVACARCGTPARCRRCQGPLALSSGTGIPGCRWCGHPAADHACETCGDRRLRASVVGARRTAEELGRAFAGAPVRTSGRDAVLATVPGEPAVVVCTPGAEPIADGGYGAVLLLDSWALLTRADLRATEEATRRWFAAAALARPAHEGGQVVVVAEGGLATVQALVRWDAAWLAARELAERRELGFPPAARIASLTGPADAVADLVAATELPDGADLLGPVDTGEEGQERILVRTSRSAGAALAAALKTAVAVRSARKTPGTVRVQVDPLELL